MKLTVVAIQNLVSVLDTIKNPSDLPTTLDVRKCLGAIDALLKRISKEKEEFDAIQRAQSEISRPVQEKINKINPNGLPPEKLPKEDMDKIQKLMDEGNKKLEPLNKQYADLVEKYKDKQVEFDMDENYKSFIKTNWEDKIRPKYLSAEALIEVADAFGI